MSFKITVKEKEENIKFNYRLYFKANKKLATKDKEGNSQNDGAGVLFVQVLEKDDDALVNLIQLVSNKATENDAVDAIDRYVGNLVADGLDEEKAYGRIFEDLKEEMLASGFFVSKIRKYIAMLQKAQKALETRGEDEKFQAKELKELADRIQKEISSSTAQGTD